MQIWEKESKDIFKVKNLRICSAMIKKHQGALCTNQNVVPEQERKLFKQNKTLLLSELKLFTLQSEPIKTLLLDKKYKSIAR